MYMCADTEESAKSRDLQQWGGFSGSQAQAQVRTQSSIMRALAEISSFNLHQDRRVWRAACQVSRHAGQQELSMELASSSPCASDLQAGQLQQRQMLLAHQPVLRRGLLQLASQHDSSQAPEKTHPGNYV